MPDAPNRITLKKLWTDLLEQLNLERGLGYTVKQFLLRPGKAVQEYLYENRAVYMKPLNFLLLTTAVTTFLMVKLVISQNQEVIEVFQSAEWKQLPEIIRPGLKFIITGAEKYFNLYYLSNLPTVAIGSYFIFKHTHDYNLAEHFVINIFVFSVQSLIYLLNIPFMASKGLEAWTVMPTLLMVGYFLYAYRQIFRLSTWRAIWYATLVYLLAQALNLILFGLIILIGIFYA